MQKKTIGLLALAFLVQARMIAVSRNRGMVPETEATKVTVTHDEWAENDPTYTACADGWPHILSRLKTLIETGKTFKPSVGNCALG